MADDKTEYRDESHINVASDVDQSKVPSTIKKLATWIRQKMYGEDVRESIARGIEKSSEVAQSAVDTANDTASRQDESEKIVQNTSDNVNNVLSEITDNAGDSAAPEVIAARNDGVKIYGTLQERLNQKVAVSTDYQSSDTINPIFNDEIDRVKSQVDSAKFNLLVNTDAHYDNRSDLGKPIQYQGAGSYSMDHLSNTVALGTEVDAVIANGDNTQGDNWNPGTTEKEMSIITNKLMDNIDSDVFMILGNHDTDDVSLQYPLASLSSDERGKPELTVSESAVKASYRTSELHNGEVRNGNSLYFYKDYPDKKIRLIGINTQDTQELVDENGVIKYPRFVSYVISQEQLEWIANVALKTTPSDYHVVMIGHAPLTNDATTPATGTMMYPTTITNLSTLATVIDAFTAGSKVQATNDFVQDYQVDVTADFTTRGAGVFVGYFCGHAHQQKLVDYHTFKICILLNSLAWTGSPSTGKTRRIGTAKEDAQTIVSIDTETRTVSLIGFGSATNAQFTY